MTGAARTRADGFVAETVRLAAGLLALATLWTHACQVLGIAFRTFAWGGLVLALLGGRLLLVGSRARRSVQEPAERASVLALVLLAAVGACLALGSLRPDADEVNYASNLHHFLARPSLPMGFEVHYLVGEGGRTPASLFQSTALAYEYVQGALAHLTGLPYLGLRYHLFPALAGALLPLAWFLLLRRVACSTREALGGAAAIVLVLLLLGEGHRAWGNYAFNRLFQAKTVFMACVLPLYAEAALAHLGAGERGSWARLALLSAASVGLTASSLPMLGILGGVLWGASVFAGGPWRPGPARSASFFASMGYLVLYGLFVIADARQHLRPEGALNAWWPTTFGGHAELMFAARVPASLLALAGSTALVATLLRGPLRRLFLAWIALLALGALNPFVAPFLIEHVTSSNIYWRLFYLLPFPLAAGWGLVLLARRAPRPAPLVAAAALVLLGAHLVPGSPSVFRNGTRFGRPAWAIAPDKLRTVRALDRALPPGTLLAPPRTSAFLSLISARNVHLLTRLDELRLWLTSQGVPLEVPNERLAAGRFLDGGDEDPEALGRVIGRHRPDAIVLRNHRWEEPAVRAELEDAGYRAHASVEEYEVLVRDASPSPRR